MKIEVFYIVAAYMAGILSMYLINHENYFMQSGKIQGAAFLACGVFTVLFFAKTNSAKKTAIFIPAFAMSTFGGLKLLALVVWFSIAGFAP